MMALLSRRGRIFYVRAQGGVEETMVSPRRSVARLHAPETVLVEKMQPWGRFQEAGMSIILTIDVSPNWSMRPIPCRLGAKVAVSLNRSIVPASC